MMRDTFSLPLRVYIEDTDAGGIVYYVNYLKFMERARTELMRTIGYDKPAIVGDLLLVVSEVEKIKYRKPALLDDQLTVTAAIQSARKATFVFAQKIYRGAELLCEATIKVACVKKDTMRPAALPLAMRERIQQLVVTE